MLGMLSCCTLHVFTDDPCSWVRLYMDQARPFLLSAALPRGNSKMCRRVRVGALPAVGHLVRHGVVCPGPARLPFAQVMDGLPQPQFL